MAHVRKSNTKRSASDSPNAKRAPQLTCFSSLSLSLLIRSLTGTNPNELSVARIVLDATGKPSAGVFEGALTMFGNYRQCLNIRAPDEDEIEITDQFEEYFRGQFCVLHLKPWLPQKRQYYHMNTSIEALLRRNYKYYEKTLYDELAEIAIAFQFIDIRMDLCVPSTCTLADIQRVADLLSRRLEMRAKVMRCDTQMRDSNLLQSVERATALWLLFPISFALLVALSSVLRSICFRKRFRRSQNNRTHTKQSAESTTLFNVLDCLSIQSSLESRLRLSECERKSGSKRTKIARQNRSHYSQDSTLSALDRHNEGGRKLADSAQSCNCNCDSNPNSTDRPTCEKPLPLYGLRSIFVLWFIVIQMTVELRYQYLRESLNLRNLMLAYWPFQVLINSTLVFESMLVVTAFAFAYANLETNFERLLASVARKYVRLTPSIATVIGLTVFVPLLNIESPVWRNFVEQQAQVCKSNGFLDLIYLQNFISYDKIVSSASYVSSQAQATRRDDSLIHPTDTRTEPNQTQKSDPANKPKPFQPNAYVPFCLRV